MELRRTLLIIAMAVVGYFLLINWQKDYYTVPQIEAQTSAAPTPTGDLPAAGSTSTAVGDVPVAPASPEPATAAADNTQRISVKTDVLEVQIDLTGGDLVRAALLEYAETAESKRPFVLLDQSAARTFIAQSGLIGPDGPDAAAGGRPQYQADANSYVLGKDDQQLNVVLRLPSQDGVEIRKIYSFTRGDYLVRVHYEIANRGNEPWQGLMFGQLKRDNTADPSAANQGFGMATFLGAAWWSPDKSYNKLALDEFAEEPLRLVVTGGWIALVQHYFVTAWIPDAKAQNTYTTRVKTDTGEHFAVFMGPTVTLAPGETQRLGASLYVGPKLQDRLAAISDGLDLTVDYGILWFIAQFLFWLLVKIHAVVGNWGWAIVILTVLVKAAFFQLSATSYRSMAHMRRVTPEIQRLREQYSNDRAKMSQAMMELYRKEKINPLGGCLPILVQMPVFIALYWTLMESVELRHADWILWINDLSAMDPYFILPLVMGASMYVQMLLNPAPPDPVQAKVMKIMPVVFTVMFLWFPAGLVLYWVVNNLLSIAQQAVITRQIEKAEGKRA